MRKAIRYITYLTEAEQKRDRFWRNKIVPKRYGDNIYVMSVARVAEGKVDHVFYSVNPHMTDATVKQNLRNMESDQSIIAIRRYNTSKEGYKQYG